jgi:hypothetical protein
MTNLIESARIINILKISPCSQFHLDELHFAKLLNSLVLNTLLDQNLFLNSCLSSSSHLVMLDIESSVMDWSLMQLKFNILK